MQALVWAGLALFALGALAWIVLKVAFYFAVIFFLIGVALVIWGGTKAKQAVD